MVHNLKPGNVKQKKHVIKYNPLADINEVRILKTQLQYMYFLNIEIYYAL